MQREKLEQADDVENHFIKSFSTMYIFNLGSISDHHLIFLHNKWSIAQETAYENRENHQFEIVVTM